MIIRKTAASLAASVGFAMMAAAAFLVLVPTKDAVAANACDAQLALDFDAFGPAAQYQFTIDVDDRLTASDLGQIRVTGGEMAGSVVTVEFQHSDGRAHTSMGQFDSQNTVKVAMEGCV